MAFVTSAPMRRANTTALRSRVTPCLTVAPMAPNKPRVPSDAPSGAKITAAHFQRMRQSAATANRHLFVLFHAAHCRACRTVHPKFLRIADEHPDVQFVDIRCEDARELCSRLGIHHVPTVQVYSGALGKVEEFMCGVSSLDKLRDTVHEFEQIALDEHE